MNKAGVDKYRELLQSRMEELTIINAEQSSHITNIKETLKDIKILLKEQNGRVRKNENALSAITAVGGILSAIFTGFIAWLFKGRL